MRCRTTSSVGAFFESASRTQSPHRRYILPAQTAFRPPCVVFFLFLVFFFRDAYVLPLWSVQGLEAINNVSRLMEGFAITLDNVIEKAFEDWGASSIIKPTEQVSSEQPLKKAVEDADASQAFEKDASWRDAADDEPSTTGNDENEEPEGMRIADVHISAPSCSFGARTWVQANAFSFQSVRSVLFFPSCRRRDRQVASSGAQAAKGTRAAQEKAAAAAEHRVRRVENATELPRSRRCC